MGSESDSLVIGVFKTSAAPVTVTHDSQIPAQPGSNEPITVNITLRQAKSFEEHVYVRWSTDTFLNSHLVKATGSQTTYSAIVPPQPGGIVPQ